MLRKSAGIGGGEESRGLGGSRQSNASTSLCKPQVEGPVEVHGSSKIRVEACLLASFPSYIARN